MYLKWLTENSSLKRKHLKPVLSVLLCGSLILSSGCALLPKEDLEENLPSITPPKLSQKPEYSVTTTTWETAIRGTGRLMSIKEEELFFIEDGKRVKEIYVSNGDWVEAGQLIAELDVSDLESQLQQRQWQSRQEELNMIEILRQADEMSPEQLERAKIEFELKRDELRKLQEAISRAKITAPFSGTVVSTYMKKGDTAKAYDTVVTIADLNKLTVAATISQDGLKQIAVGMEVKVEINGYRGDPLVGTVDQLPNPKSDNNQGGGMYPGYPGYQPQQDSIENYVVVKLDPFPEGLNRGTPLSVSVIVNRKENAVVIPTAALRTYAGRNYVQVVESDGTKREVDVEIGLQKSTEVEILKGLTPGQKVVGR